MDRGELVSDEIVSALIDAELAALDDGQGAIFDGYHAPRNRRATSTRCLPSTIVRSTM